MHGGTDLADLAGQLDAGDKGHADVGQQQVRFELLDKLKRIKAVAGAAHEMKAEGFPRDHCADGFPQFVLVVCYDNGVEVLFCHRLAPSFFTLQPELDQAADGLIKGRVLADQAGFGCEIDAEAVAGTGQHRQR